MGLVPDRHEFEEAVTRATVCGITIEEGETVGWYTLKDAHRSPGGILACGGWGHVSTYLAGFAMGLHVGTVRATVGV